MDKNVLVYHSGSDNEKQPLQGNSAGVFINDLNLGSGKMKVEFEFEENVNDSAFGLILYYDINSSGFIEIQVGGPNLCTLFTFIGGIWTPLAAHGPAGQLSAGTPYSLEVDITGSRVQATLNNVRVIDANLREPLPVGPTGVYALGPNDITVRNFKVEIKPPKIFVVMQFTDPFNELYRSVIKPVSESNGYSVVRADEHEGPGIIIADIERQIIDANVVVADITPNNANVFWEVGYAHAIRKPTVLLAERGTKLPFDVSPFRVLFYDNTIQGKASIEEGLAKHLDAIKNQWLSA